MTEPASPPSDDPSAARLRRLADFLALDPCNATLLRDCAGEALRAGQFEAVLGAVERLRVLGEEHAPERRLRVSALRRAGRSDEARAALEDGLARWPADAGLSLEHGRALATAGELERALQALPDASDAGSLAGPIVAWRVRLLHHLDRLDEAETAAREHVERHGPDDGVEAVLLGVLVDRARLKEAAHRARALVDRRATAGAAFPHAAAEPLALAALHEGRLEAAREWTERALAERDDDGRGWLVRGLAQLAAAQGEQAERSLERAVAALPRHAGSLLALGWAHLLHGERTAARRAFDAALAATPALADAQGSVAVLEALDGELAPARAAIRRAVGLDPANVPARLAAALLEGPIRSDEIARIAHELLTRARRNDLWAG